MYQPKNRKHITKHHLESAESVANNIGMSKLKQLHKVRKISRQSLIRQLDREMSEYVRERDGRSVLSGATEKLTNGHLFSRVNYSTRWDELNCHAQTAGENFRHEEDPYPYTRWFITEYGIEKYDELYRKHRMVMKWSTAMLLTKLEEIKEKRRKLNKSVDIV